MDAALEGIRVVELAQYVAVPAAGALLTDLGAEVIKIETPPMGELYRLGRPKYAGYDTEFPESPPFQMDNAGKRSLMLDVTQPDAQQALLRVIESADIFITNLLPPRRVRFGVDHESLLTRFPRLIVGAISGYGWGGPDSDDPAFDYTAFWARTGMMDMTHDQGVPPSLLRSGVGDHAAASNLVCGLLAALRLRDATGKGRFVDVSLLQTGLHLLGNDVALSLVTGETPQRHDRSTPMNPLWNSYPTQDERWLMLVMIDPERYWVPLCETIGRPELAEDERFADGFARMRNSAELTREFEQVFRTKTLLEWEEILSQTKLIWAPVRTVGEAINDAHSDVVGCFPLVSHPEAGEFRSVGPPFRISGLESGERRPAPALNADGKTILREVGLDDSEIEKLLRF